jgi:putative oxidoreductase
MIVAILKVHVPAGFFAPNGVEFPLTLLAGSLLIALTGAGRWSIDALIGERTQSRLSGSETPRIRRAA